MQWDKNGNRPLDWRLSLHKMWISYLLKSTVHNQFCAYYGNPNSSANVACGPPEFNGEWKPAGSDGADGLINGSTVDICSVSGSRDCDTNM